MKTIINHITKNQYIFILHSSMVGVGVLSLAAGVSKDAHQSGWISVLIAGIYPLLCTMVSAYVYKSVNYVDYFKMSRKLYGNTLTYIFTLIFIANFIFLEAFVLSGFVNLMKFSIAKFLSPYTIIIVTVILVVITSRKGFTNIARLSEIMFYINIFVLIVPLYFIGKGSITNLMPVVEDLGGVLKAVKSVLYSYSGAEICFFIAPFVTDKKKLKSAGIIGSLLTVLFYALIVLLVVYCIGWRFSSKLQYPLLYIVASIDISVISSFETLFIFAWGNKVFQILSIVHSGLSYCSSNLFGIPYQKVCYLLVLPPAIIASFLVPEHKRSAAIDIITPYFVIFIILWALLTFLFSYIRKRSSKNESI